MTAAAPAQSPATKPVPLPTPYRADAAEPAADAKEVPQVVADSNDIPDDQLEAFYDTLGMICEKLKLAETELENELLSKETV